MQAAPLSAEAIAAVIRAAAENHVNPVKPESLLDVRIARQEKYLRSHLGSIVALRLYREHGQTIDRIAKAFKLDPCTIRYRLGIGMRLIRKSPWKQTYQSLP